MEVNWEKAAVFTALAIFIAPLLYTHTTTLLSRLFKSTRRIPHLPWSALPQGRLHSCSATQGPFTPCQHSAGPHAPQKRCWEADTGLAVVLNRAWQGAGAQDRVQVPDWLPLLNRYVCTDARTVLAFVLATAPASKMLGPWNVAAGRYGGTRLSCCTVCGKVVCHLHGAFQRVRSELTKHEVERLLDGYPPWYRDRFTSWGNARPAFPLTSLQDVSRGGWIVAVGLMDLNSASQAPLALYRCENEPGEPGWRGNGVVYRAAVERCLEHVRRHILPVFQDDDNVNAAVTMLEYLVAERTASGMACPGQFRETWRMSSGIPHLKSSECAWLMQKFNQFQAVDVAAGERDKWKGMLLPAMAAVVHGAVEVIEYLKDVGVEFKFPTELRDLEQEVYLRDCLSVPVFE